MYVLNAQIFEGNKDKTIPVCSSTDKELLTSLMTALTKYSNEHPDTDNDERLYYILSEKSEKELLRNVIRNVIPDFRTEFVFDAIMKASRDEMIKMSSEMWTISEIALI